MLIRGYIVKDIEPYSFPFCSRWKRLATLPAFRRSVLLLVVMTHPRTINKKELFQKASKCFPLSQEYVFSAEIHEQENRRGGEKGR